LHRACRARTYEPWLNGTSADLIIYEHQQARLLSLRRAHAVPKATTHDAMANIAIQFQKGLTLQSVLKQFGTDTPCADPLELWRWPQGFVCPDCGHAEAPVRLRTRGLLQCRHRHHQTSLTAGTIFASTKLVLTTWFLALFFLTQQKTASPRSRSCATSACRTQRHGG
jgi:hypothetical protein